MKKSYQIPKTEHIQMLGQSAIMVGSVLDLGGGSGTPGIMD